MQPVKMRAFGMGAVLVAFGAFLLLTKEASAAGKTEEWMASQAPTIVEGTPYNEDPNLPGQSYKMNKDTYDQLHPYGIVSRTYVTKYGTFDAVLIASNSKNSFHDPRVCFSGSGFSLEGQQAVTVPTKTRGTVPATFTRLEGKGGNQVSIFTYKGPYGFVGTTTALKIDLLKHEILKAKPTDGVFYRFIELDDNASREKLERFVGEFLDAANKSSDGYY